MVKQLVLPLLAVAAFIVLVGLFIKKAPTITLPGATPASQSLTVGSKSINIELANTQSLRATGLSGRSSLDQNSGMLFVFDKKGIAPSFWMKGMLIPLDIIWIRGDRIIKIDKNVQPPPANLPDQSLTIYSSGQPIDYVLEVNAGFSDQNGIKVGDQVVLPNL